MATAAVRAAAVRAAAVRAEAVGAAEARVVRRAAEVRVGRLLHVLRRQLT
jgi:hypothetical protein